MPAAIDVAGDDPPAVEVQEETAPGYNENEPQDNHRNPVNKRGETWPDTCESDDF
jgi:hypothetical protein